MPVAHDRPSCGDAAVFVRQAASGDAACLRSAELRRKLAFAAARPDDSTAPVSLASYIRNLVLMHDVVRASIPLMQAARDRCVRDDDERSRALARYFEEHIVEEDGHVELGLDDLEELGISRAESQRRAPNPYAAAAVGAQYYWIAHHSPIALLGYIAFLEGCAPTQHDIATVRAVMPPGVDALRSFRVHAESDPGHTTALDALIDALDLSDADAALLGVSALQTAMLLAEARSHARRVS